MVRRFFLIVCAAIISIAASAQGEQDFASRFMALYTKGTTAECTTVSPLMMQRMMQLPNVEDDEQTRQVLAQLKSIRMVTHTKTAEAQQLYDNAELLAKRNPSRYKLYASESGKRLYVRRRRKTIVEMVLFMEQKQGFSLINLTGNMTEHFLEQLLRI